MLVLQTMQNGRVMELWRLPLRVQKNAWEGRQCVAVLKSLQATSWRAMHETVMVKTKL
jgi:hypothetical protein